MKLLPQRNDIKSDGMSNIKLLAVVDGYVVCRKKGAAPFIRTLKWWERDLLDERMPTSERNY